VNCPFNPVLLCRYEENESVWVWEYPVEDGHHDMFLDPGEQIRFRVVSETFTGITRVVPSPGDMFLKPGEQTRFCTF